MHSSRNFKERNFGNEIQPYFSKQTSVSIDSLRKGGKEPRHHTKPPTARKSLKDVTNSHGARKKVCRRCGAEGHSMYSKHCPAWGLMCDKCKGKHHYTKMCQTKNAVEVEINDSDSEDDVCLDSMDTPSKSGNTWFAKV